MKDFNTKIIAAFYGLCDKSIEKEVDNCLYLNINFNNIDTTNKTFIKNYINDIKSNVGKYEYIIIDLQLIILQELDKQQLKYYVVYPNIVDKEYYLSIYRKDNYPESFITNITQYWNNYLININNYTSEYVTKITLNCDTYLGSIVQDLESYQEAKILWSQKTPALSLGYAWIAEDVVIDIYIKRKEYNKYSVEVYIEDPFEETTKILVSTSFIFSEITLIDYPTSLEEAVKISVDAIKKYKEKNAYD